MKKKKFCGDFGSVYEDWGSGHSSSTEQTTQSCRRKKQNVWETEGLQGVPEARIF